MKPTGECFVFTTVPPDIIMRYLVKKKSAALDSLEMCCGVMCRAGSLYGGGNRGSIEEVSELLVPSIGSAAGKLD